jgi:hypothetical protein
MPRSPAIHHCTSLPLRFFGRRAELELLDESLRGGDASVVAFVGPGGQGKTAIVQHWLQTRAASVAAADGLFLWSFYRGKDSDLCLRELFAYAEGLDAPPDVAASFCVDRLLPRLRTERWAIVFDGAEVVQHESGAWRGRFLHPELGRLVESLAEESMPGVLALTTRFELPTLGSRRHSRLVSLSTLDPESGVALLESLGVRGNAEQLRAAVAVAGGHAKAVELVGTWLTTFHVGDAGAIDRLPNLSLDAGSDEERHVLRVLSAFHQSLPAQLKDILALTTAFRQPPNEAILLKYLVSEPVRHLLHDVWKRSYPPFALRQAGWLNEQLESLVDMRLLERVSASLEQTGSGWVFDAHPLVRRGFEDVLGVGSPDALARAGFLRSRPDRQKPASIAEAREEVELFHAYCDAGLWSEADSAFRGLDNPKHRFLAPAFERDLLLRFFPAGDWRQPPLWSGFGRYRSLAICAEMLGEFEDALAMYRADDAPLRGDALLALGRLGPFLTQPQAAQPWQALWHAYRAHALCLAGQADEALRLAQSAIPLDIYEWVHVFEALLRLDRLDLLDMRSLQPAAGDESEWSRLARRRLEFDHRRRRGTSEDLTRPYLDLIEAYDRAGLPFERALTRLSFGRYAQSIEKHADGVDATSTALDIARRYRMPILAADALELLRELGRPIDANEMNELRRSTGFRGPTRP